MTHRSPEDRRSEMQRRGLTEQDLLPDPHELLKRWLHAASEAQFPEPTAMILATSTGDGRPSARVVLLKDISDQGLVFYTNYESRKGRELSENPSAALLFYWDALARQVRVEGAVRRTTAEESAKYFRTRPFESQIGAWASRQSSVLKSREELEKRFAELNATYRGREVPLPPFWGGFRLIPAVFEFWQGRESRLHDRFRYSKREGRWAMERLSP